MGEFTYAIFLFFSVFKIKKKKFSLSGAILGHWGQNDQEYHFIFFILAQGCNKKNKKYKVYLILFFVSIS